MVGAAGFAAFSAGSAEPAPQSRATPKASEVGAVPEIHAAVLPPNHPPLGSPTQGSPAGPPVPASDEGPAITWKVPGAWKAMKSSSAMRIGTYCVNPGSHAALPAEVSVVRAGGTTEANIQRWLDQFDDAGQETRTTKTVRGLKITIVEVRGTYLGGSMTPDASPVAHSGWALLGAIVEAPSSPYFFKLTGEAGTVHAARASFDELLDSVTPF